MLLLVLLSLSCSPALKHGRLNEETALLASGGEHREFLTSTPATSLASHTIPTTENVITYLFLIFPNIDGWIVVAVPEPGG